MNITPRLRNLLGIVFVILIGYGFADLHDYNKTQQEILLNQQKLLARQTLMLSDNSWPKRLADAENLKKQWLYYVPEERDVTSAKAQMLGRIREAAKNAGVIVTSASAEETILLEAGSKNDVSGSKVQTGKKDKRALPEGINSTKINIAGRFDPYTLKAFLSEIEEAQHFAIIDVFRVKGTGFELTLNCYWREKGDEVRQK